MRSKLLKPTLLLPSMLLKLSLRQPVRSMIASLKRIRSTLMLLLLKLTSRQKLSSLPPVLKQS